MWDLFIKNVVFIYLYEVVKLAESQFDIKLTFETLA